MIQSFADPETDQLWNGKRSRKMPSDIQSRGLAKLLLIDAAETLDDLKNPPSNRFHPLSGDRAGQHSVSINMKWRICFRWNDGNAYDVEITNHYE
ncbi:type II toxin-antitoxin system RelE/ParE family toxin [Citromicrobium bathyomarinum]|uniref:type II toxin-antitoxin system RelE/ParE family toxin n=1 Tax=Citromicrobium bathyomarinum TaxID=72174 RepID=UPI00315A7929